MDITKFILLLIPNPRHEKDIFTHIYIYIDR